MSVSLAEVAASTSDDLLDHARARRAPVNLLVSTGRASIGCAPRTKPVDPGEDPPSGPLGGLVEDGVRAALMTISHAAHHVAGPVAVAETRGSAENRGSAQIRGSALTRRSAQTPRSAQGRGSAQPRRSAETRRSAQIRGHSADPSESRQISDAARERARLSTLGVLERRMPRTRGRLRGDAA
ncbi:hypothetical protein GCM10009739_02300 [Microbacterium ulmi]